MDVGWQVVVWRLGVLDSRVPCFLVGQSGNALSLSASQQPAGGRALNRTAIAWPCPPSFSGKAADAGSEHSELQTGKIMS